MNTQSPVLRRRRPADSFRSFSAAAMVIMIGLGLLIVLPALVYGTIAGDQLFVYFACSLIAFLIPLSVALRNGRHVDPFEPIMLVALAVFFGNTSRSIWMMTASDKMVEDNMWWTTLDRVNGNMPLILLSLLTFCLGYALMSNRYRLERLPFVRDFRMTRSKFWLSIVITLAISFVGLIMMMQDYGIQLNASMLSNSKKRVMEYTNENGEIVYGRGYSRYLAMIAVQATTVLGAAMIARIIRPSQKNVVLLIGIGLYSCLAPFFTSSRSVIILMMINLVIFAFYYKRLSLKWVGGLIAASVLIIVTLGALREQNQLGAVDENASAADRLFGSGNSIDFIRTSSIMDRVPETYPYMYGKSYVAVVLGYIPRSVWLDKPQVGLGGIVKEDIFHQPTRQGGFPSGIIGEGWMNFGLFGMFIPIFLIGWFMRYVYETVRPLLGVSFLVTLLYAVSIWPFGFLLVQLNFAHGINITMIAMLPVLIMLMIARGKTAALGKRPAK